MLHPEFSQAVGPFLSRGLTPGSGDRPGGFAAAAFHGLPGMARDFYGPAAVVLEAFLLIYPSWPGGIGIGQPPGAQIHIHLDRRQHVKPADVGFKAPAFGRAVWIELGQWGPDYREIVQQQSSPAAWEAAIAALRKAYGLR